MLRLLMDILRGRALSFRASVLDLVQEFVQIRDDVRGIAVRGLAVTNLLHFIRDEVLHLQHMLHQLHMGNIVRMGLPQIEEDILQFV